MHKWPKMLPFLKATSPFQASKSSPVVKKSRNLVIPAFANYLESTKEDLPVVGHILWVDPHRFSLESDEILWSTVGLKTVATDQVLFLANAFPELGGNTSGQRY
jgi:hypothetical protein